MFKVYVSFNCVNIFLYKMKVSRVVYEVFGWFINMIKEKGFNILRVIIIYYYFKLEFGGNVYYFFYCVLSSVNMIIGMYYYNSLKKYQERVFDSLFYEVGVCRVVFVLIALGMGVNIKDIFMVIYYGLLMYMDDFVQEMGRVGYDLQLVKVIFIYYGSYL